MKAYKLEDLSVWNSARSLNKISYALALKILNRDIRSQVIRASFSISANVAEGFGRGSDRAFVQFLKIAHGSGVELKAHLIGCVDVGLLTQTDADPVLAACDDLLPRIRALTAYLSKSSGK